jgi:hypothetical protein
MNRSEWTFPYTADKLLEAATVKRSFHAGRLEWWQNQQKQVEDKIRSEGIEIDESVAAGKSDFHSNTTYRAPTVSIRNDLVVDLRECNEKISEHKTKVKDYDAWTQVLASQGQSSFDLNQDDWLFFFGK